MLPTRVAAIRAARAFTGRSKVIVLENPTAPASIETLGGVEVIASGKLSLLCKTIAESDDRVAAIVAEPLPGHDLLHKRFIKRVRALACAEGAILIWDEVSFGAHVPSAELLEFYGITPDLVCRGETDECGSARLGGRMEVIEAGRSP